MNKPDAIPAKIMDLAHLKMQAASWRVTSKTIAFTNGVFDLLHAGHIFSLSQAAAEANYLVVGVNSDASVRRLKGPERPIHDEQTRALILASLSIVDAVIIFDADTPYELITALKPDVLVKGGDYTNETIVGAKEVLADGGRVVINSLLPNLSTTAIISKIKK